MKLFDFRRSPAYRPDNVRLLHRGDSLKVDELLLLGSDDLGLEVDSDGFLKLTEGVDAE
ncbi:MAG: hypothetical protein ACFCUT_21160 [Kiloniellaceae bacterium]